MQHFVRIAAIQARPVSVTFDELAAGRDVPHALDLADRAAAGGGDILCFPELYPWAGEAELREKARETGTYIVAGLPETENGATYNTAVLIDREGRVAGRQRKVYPTAGEVARGIVPGSCYNIYETELGRIGLIICADLPFSRHGIVELKRGGADIVFNPSWWFALGEAYPASVIGRHLEYGLPIIGVDIARHAMQLDETGATRFPPAGGYTTVTVTPPCRTVEELGEWFRTKPGGINSMADFARSLGEEEGILEATVDIEAVRHFPGYYFSETAAEVTAAGLTPV